MTPPELALVVPCYNEASRLDPEAFLRFVTTHPRVQLVLVDDGSSDGTGEILEADPRGRACVGDDAATLAEPGKAEAVRAGILAGLAQRAALVGYFDADLATPLRAVDDFLAVLRDRPAVEFVLGSRVMLLGRDIKRKATRHYLGSVFATAVSHVLDLPVYDTQRGAKVLRANSATATLFDTPFRSAWIFDVELIARYLRLPVASGEPARPIGSTSWSCPSGTTGPGRSSAGMISRARWSSSDTFGVSGSRTVHLRAWRPGCRRPGTPVPVTIQPSPEVGLAQESRR